MTDDRLCRHCLLTIGPRAMRRTVNGENCAFCCYGCCIAFQVRSGKSEEWEAAWLLIRLGVGGFLSMNIMLFSLLLYAGAFTGVDARLLPWVHLLLWIFATPALVILGGPFLRETWLDGVQGRLRSSALIVVGVGAAYIYSAFAVIERSTHVYFDTATMVLMLFTVGRYLEAAGRARAARDLEPLLAAESECATVVNGGAETRRAVRDVKARMLVRVRPGERIPVDGVVTEGESHTDEAVITGESRQVAKSVGSPVIAGSINLDGPLLIQSSGAGTATRWAQICRSVRDALVRRSPTQRIADRVVGASVPVVLALGGLTMFYWAQWLLVLARWDSRRRLRPRSASGGWHAAAAWSATPACSRPSRARDCSPSTRLARSRRAKHMSLESRAMASGLTRCSHGLPGWSAIPSMVWPAPSPWRPRRAASSRLWPVMFGACPAAGSGGVSMGKRWRPGTAL
jgi:Cu2+-exporting ATPase